ncbi:MAG: PilC/PilY family type IV pilus protein [Steroidobacteraceae bacterium]
MSIFNHPCGKTLAFALLTVGIALPAAADDIEIYQSSASAGAKPNVLFIIDTSGSMDGDVVTAPLYDPNTVYAGSCDASRIYFSTNDTPPDCGTSNWIPQTSNNCAASFAALTNIGGSGTWPSFGNSRERAAQYRSGQWRGIQGMNTGYMECRPDNGVHGQNGTTTKRYPRNGTTPPWSSSSTLSWGSIGGSYRFYTANYMNYRNGLAVPMTMTRLQIVRDVAINLASSLQNVNLGLMRYNENAQGGYVLHAIEDIDTSRAGIISALQALDPKDGNGGTPLSETLYEAAHYLTGGSVVYGDQAQPGVSDDAARKVPGGGEYKSPLNYQCQKNYVVYLTDGAPTVDDDAIDDIGTMIGGACKADPIEPFHDGGWVAGSGICMDDLAAWLNTSDLSSSLAGTQTASTYMVGFGDSLTNQTPGDTPGYLNEIAKAGGTEHAYSAGDVPTLTAALQTIFSGIQDKSATFITPSISVNTFNRAQTSTDLFFSLFKVAQGEHWPGNLKKYKLDGTSILDANDDPAVAPTGFFADGTTSLWSPVADGSDVTKGGATSQLPAPAARKLYTHVAATNRLADSANELSTANSTLTDALVGAGASTTSCGTECQNAINWIRGFDVGDNNGDGSTTDAVRFMGDPLHGRPAVVGYGGSIATPDADDTVVYFPTNDGLLHAISGRTGTGGGTELWAFMPPQLLPRLYDLYQNSPTPVRSYGLDGDVQMLKFDKNQDGIVDASAGDKVWLFFGMRAGGNRYFALDVTDRNDPRLLWSIGALELPGVGQSWSPPTIARVSVGTGGSANTSAEKFVLIFGGGYDMGQETQPYTNDAVGNRIFMVDAESGNRLWFGGGAGTGTPDVTFAKMTNSIPARVRVIDTDGDLFADRMYAADMGGRVWRFDITNGQPAASLVAGGVIAQLGVGSNSPAPGNADNRRFYNAPDVALIQRRAEDPYYNIAIGSGYRGHPLDTVTQDRFYAIRDKMPYARLTQAQYNAVTPLLDSDLVDITADPAGSTVLPMHAGWKFVLPAQAGRTGEKVLAEATTVNNVLLFTTFQPLPPSGTDPCYPANINRAYAMRADTGKPALDFNDDGVTDNADVSVDLRQSGIVGDITVALIRQANQDPLSPPSSPPTACLAGVEVLSKCVGAGGTVRTFWQRDDAQ